MLELRVLLVGLLRGSMLLLVDLLVDLLLLLGARGVRRDCCCRRKNLLVLRLCRSLWGSRIPWEVSDSQRGEFLLPALSQV